jgi:hypothetical protein
LLLVLGEICVTLKKRSGRSGTVLARRGQVWARLQSPLLLFLWLAEDALVSNVRDSIARVSTYEHYTYTCTKVRPAALSQNSDTDDITVGLKPRVLKSHAACKD